MKHNHVIDRSNPRNRRRLAAALLSAALVLGSSQLVGAAGGSVPDTEPTYTGCLRTSGSSAGTLVAIKQGNAPSRACNSTEKPIRLSAGDITSVHSGTGLRITSGGLTGLGFADAQGLVSVDLAPPYRLPQTCTDGQVATRQGNTWQCSTPPPPKKAVLIHSDWGGPVADDFSRLGGSATLPAGSWSIVAKADFQNITWSEHAVEQLQLECRLGVGSNPVTDDAKLIVKESDGNEGEVVLMTATKQIAPFNVSMECKDWGLMDAGWHQLRIIATPVDDMEVVGL